MLHEWKSKWIHFLSTIPAWANPLILQSNLIKKKEKGRKNQKALKTSRQFLDVIQYPWKLIELVGRLWVHQREKHYRKWPNKAFSPIAPIFQAHRVSNAWTWVLLFLLRTGCYLSGSAQQTERGLRTADGWSQHAAFYTWSSFPKWKSLSVYSMCSTGWRQTTGFIRDLLHLFFDSIKHARLNVKIRAQSHRVGLAVRLTH